MAQPRNKTYDKLDYFSKVFYTEYKGRHRPYLGVVFSKIHPKNAPEKQVLMSPRILGLIDSGADHTVIPYSIGKAIGLEEPNSTENLIIVGGVGGSVNCVERTCSIFVGNELKKEVYEFKETLWWKVPGQEIKDNLARLVNELNENVELQRQSKPGTDLHTHFNKEIEDRKNKISEINASLEGDALMGRPFFDNFEFIQFSHTDRAHEEKCFFNYKVRKSKVTSKTPYPIIDDPKPKESKNKIGIAQSKK